MRFFLILILAHLSAVIVPNTSWAFLDLLKNNSGVKAYQAKKYDEALQSFSELDANQKTPRYHYNSGEALYRLNKYDEAEKEYLQSLNAKEPAIRLKSLYKLGNVKFRQNDLKNSLDYYEKALKIDPDYQEAKLNRDFVQAKLKEEQKKEKDQNEQKDKNQQNKEDKSQDKDSSSKDSKDNNEQNKQEGDSKNKNEPEKKSDDKNEASDQSGQESKEEKSKTDESKQKEEADKKAEAMKLPQDQLYRILDSLEDDPNKALKQGIPLEKSPGRKTDKPW